MAAYASIRLRNLAEDYIKVMPKLVIFDGGIKTVKDQVQEAIGGMDKEQFGRLLEFIKGKNRPKK